MESCQHECQQGDCVIVESTRFAEPITWPVPVGEELDEERGFVRFSHTWDHDVYQLVDIDGSGSPDIVWSNDATLDWSTEDRRPWGYPDHPHWRFFASVP